jgi:hypothetical protein
MAEEGVPDMTLISDMDETGINRNLQVPEQEVGGGGTMADKIS